MKVTPKHYAKALYDSLENMDAKEATAVIAKFLVVLKKNNYMSKSEKIIAEFIKIWNRQKGLVSAEIVSAGKLGDEVVGMLNDHLAKLTGSVFVETKESIDKSLKGGVILKFGDKVLDGSLRTRLRDLREEIAR